MVGFYRCPHCGQQQPGTGKFGQPTTCVECGMRLSAKLSDKARRHRILQVAVPYGMATFLFALAIFYPHLPSSPWERLFSPILVSPSIASVAVVYRILTKHKTMSAADEVLFTYFKVGMALFGVSLAVAIIVARL